MSSIRRQSIISSVIVYFGFALGFFNTYLFTREGSGFSKEEYGVTGIFIAFASIMFSVASVGMPAYINKFFPYYNAHLPPKKNDQLAWALILPIFGFLLIIIAGLVFKDMVIDKVFNNSPELLEYYYWTFPFGFGYTIFLVLEAYAWQQREAVVSNFFKEVGFRFIVTILIVLATMGFIKSFDGFIIAYALVYILLTGMLLYYLRKQRKLYFSFSVSVVTRRFYRKIVRLVSYVWGGSLVYHTANVFDTIVIAAVLPNAMVLVALFTLAQNISSLIQAPQRAMISASLGPLSLAWKDKNLQKINTIYRRSSINLLIFSSAMLSLIYLNFDDGISTFNLQEGYRDAKYIFLLIGITRVIDMGTGLNSQIIATSTYWKFEFMTGLILLMMALPLNYFLTRELGVIGPAISNVIAFTIYNGIRFGFLWRKFKMQPFTIRTLYTLLLAFTSYIICYYLFDDRTGIGWIVLRSTVFILLFVPGMIMLKLTSDLKPVLATIRKRLRM